VKTEFARAANDLAAAERAAGNRDRARELHQQALALRRQGGDAVLIAESLNNLANSERDPAIVGELLVESHRLRAEVLGDDHPLTVQSLLNRGSHAVTEGDFARAAALAQEAIDRARPLGGAGTAQLAMALRTQAYASLRTGDAHAAERAITEALALDRARLGPEHPTVAAHLEVLVAIHEHREHWAAALATWNDILAIRRALLPAGHEVLERNQRHLEAVRARAGR
jgi:serine/threonine-protein kinase